MEEELEEEQIHVYVWLSLFTVHLKLTILLIGYTPKQNKKFRRKKIILPGLSSVPLKWNVCHCLILSVPFFQSVLLSISLYALLSNPAAIAV